MSAEYSKAQSLERGAVVLLLSTVLVKLIGAFFKIPLSSDICLGDLGFGYFSSVYDIFSPIYTLAITGFPVAVSHLIADFAAQKRFCDVKSTLFTARRLFLKLGIASAVVMALLILPFVRLTDDTGQSIYGLFAMVPSLVFCFLVSVYRGYYEGLRNMTPAAVSSVIEALCKLILGFGFAVLTVRLTENVAFAAAAAMFGISVGTLISALYLHIKFKADGKAYQNGVSESYLKAQPDFEKSLKKMLIVFTVPVAVSSLAGSMVSVIDSITVRAQLSVTAAENYELLKNMYSAALSDYNTSYGAALSKEALPTFLYGIRSKAFTLYNLVPTFTAAIGVSAVPVITEVFSKKDITAVKQNICNVLKLTALISFPAGIGLFVLSRRIMELLYGAGGSAEVGGSMLALYGIAALFSGLVVTLCCVLQAVKRQNAVLINVLVGVAVKLALNLVLSSLPKLNVFGAVFSTLICYAVIFLLHMFTLLRTVGKLGALKTAFLKPFIAAFVCGTAAYFVSLISVSKAVTVLSILVAAFIYALLVVWLRVFSVSEIVAIPLGSKLLKALKKLKKGN